MVFATAPLEGHGPLRFERSALGQETRRQSSQGFDLRQDWDDVGQLKSQKAWGTKSYDYDPNGQITKTLHGDDSEERFQYGADLNLKANQFADWQTSAAGVVHIARGPRGEKLRLEYDANGRVIKRTLERNGFRPQTWVFEWNAQDQLVKAHCPDGAVWTYAYDPFGRRISKECAESHTSFTWDGDVIALEATTAGGHFSETEWFFEPDSFRPLARKDSLGLSYIVNDHLGTPKEMVDERGSLFWATDHDTWGTVRKCRTWQRRERPQSDGYVLVSKGDIGALTATAQKIEAEPDPYLCPIRFQGQWGDEETGLYYNRFRYYEPNAGQYLSKDPIGLWAGFRNSHYVKVPTSFSDPFGLQGQQAARCHVQGLTHLPQEMRDRFSRALSAVRATDMTSTETIRASAPDYVCCNAGRRRQWGAPFRNDNPDPNLRIPGDRDTTYREWEVPSADGTVGPDRIITGSDGTIWGTTTHYGDNPGRCFFRIS